MRAVRRILAFVVVLFAVVLLGGWWYVRASLPVLDGELVVAGLDATVEVERDSLGVVEVTASNRADASFALGFVHAQERHFQMDLLRRAAAGELAALLGPDLVSADTVLRPHRFRAAAERALAAMPQTHRAIVDAYAEGVNAGREALAARPWEYAVLRADPEPWRPEDSLLAAYAMVLDLQRSALTEELEEQAERALLPPAVAAFFDPAGDEWDAPLTGDALTPPPVPALEDMGGYRPGPIVLQETARDPMAVGSNNWAVAGSQTATGAALVADDMHLGLGLPNIWFRATLVVDGPGGTRMVSGVTLPGAPLVIVGSNGHVAWGFTNAYGDFADLVRLEPADRRGWVRTDTGSVALDTLRETITVASGEARTLDIVTSPWGPVLYRQPDRPGEPPAAYAVQWAAHRDGAINLGLLDMETASSVAEALPVAHAAGIPAQNLVVGGRDGAIAWTIIGQVPRRTGRDGTVPVASTDPNARWDGFLSSDEIPTVVSPASGVIWTANNRVVGGEAGARLGLGPRAHGARAQQIRDRLLALDTPVTEADLLAIQTDDEARFLQRWRSLLLDVLSHPDATGSEALAGMREAVESGGRRAHPGDAGYRLVDAFRQTVTDRLKSAYLGPTRSVFGGANDLREASVWQLVTERPSHFLPEGADSWSGVLRDAALWVADRPGAAEPTRAEIEHPMADALGPLGRWLRMPADPLSGDDDMPAVSASSFGASERMVVSPGHEERGILHMPGGQAGHPLSPYWGAGHDAWVEGRPLPFLPGRPVWTLRLSPLGA